MLRFFVDECVASSIDGLRAHGFDVLNAKDVCPGDTDDRALSLAATAGRVVITDDRGFGGLAVRHEQPATGVIVLALYELREGIRETYAVEQIAHVAERAEGKLVIIEPGRIRSRPLPGRSA
jgi:predicted nuclease of predicted toxin-antitoxin system